MGWSYQGIWFFLSTTQTPLLTSKFNIIFDLECSYGTMVGREMEGGGPNHRSHIQWESEVWGPFPPGPHPK